MVGGLKDGQEIVTGSYKVIRTLRNDARVKVDNKAPSTETSKDLIEWTREPKYGTGSYRRKIERGEQLKREGVIIRTFDLWKTYVMGDQEIHAVSGVDVEIRKGEYVAIMGPSGSGKSTLMNLIGCLDTPTGGMYYLNGKLVSDMD